MEVALDHSNRSNAELQKALKRLQDTVGELQAQVEDEQRQRDEAREAAAAAERRANLIAGELEELRTALDQAERSRRAAEAELNDAADRISELSTQNATISSQKRQLESAVAAMQADLDEAVAELKNTEERAKKAGEFFSFEETSCSILSLCLVADAMRLSEELRLEQEHTIQVERLRKGLEQQIKDLQTRLDEAEGNALKGGKRIIAKLEQRVRSEGDRLSNDFVLLYRFMNWRARMNWNNIVIRRH